MAMEKIATRPSSQVLEAYYDPDEQQMTVTFSKGAQYLYNGVDQATADAMANTPWNDMKQMLLDYQRIA